MIARPWLSRKNVLFGVAFGSTEVWSRKSVRRMVKRFVAACAAITVILAAAFGLLYSSTMMSEAALSRLYALWIAALLLFNLIPYVAANRSMKKLKASIRDENLVKGRVSVEIGNSEASRPISAKWFGLLPVPIAATVAWTLIDYSDLPAKVATHYAASVQRFVRPRVFK